MFKASVWPLQIVSIAIFSVVVSVTSSSSWSSSPRIVVEVAVAVEIVAVVIVVVVVVVHLRFVVLPISLDRNVSVLNGMRFQYTLNSEPGTDAEHGPWCELGAPAAGSHVANPEGVLRGRSAGAAGDDSGQEDACRVNQELLDLRGELEDRWARGEVVQHMIQEVTNAILGDPRMEHQRKECLEVVEQMVVVVPGVPLRNAAEQLLPLSPAQRCWVKRTLEAVVMFVGMGVTEEDVVDLMQRALASSVKPGKRDVVQALNDELGQRPEEEATTMAMKLMRAIQPRAAQVKDWERVQAVLVAHTGKRGNIWCGDKLTAQEEWVTQWMNNLLHEHHGGALLSGEVASSSSDAPTVLAEGEKPEDQRDRLEEIQNQHDTELFEWHQRQSEKEAAEEAKRREDATMAAHMSWSTRPAQKKLRISLDVRSGRTTRYSETEVPDGEVVTIALQAAIVEGGEESYHRGKRMDAKEAREALREEEERLEHHRPGSAPQQPRRVAVSDAELKAYAKAWKSGSIDFDGLAMAVGADMAMEILRTAESESLKRR